MPLRHVLIVSCILLCSLATIGPVRAEKEERPDERTEKRDVQAQLERRFPQLHFDEVSLSDLIDFFRDVSSFKITVRWKVLKDAGVDRHRLVSLELENVTMAQALDKLLEAAGGDVKLAYEVTEDGVIISTADDISKKAVRKKDAGKKAADKEE